MKTTEGIKGLTTPKELAELVDAEMIPTMRPTADTAANTPNSPHCEAI